jgi:superfamily I DNA/RNA helicase
MGEQILSNHADVREVFRQRFTRVTVDEFQDTNALQMRLLQQLVGPPNYHVCVVGDDDQSIYGWRGAEVANILQFEKFFPNPKIIRLEENYRSTHAVLHTANSLIKHNIGRREKILRSTRKDGDPVRIVAMPGDDQEAEFIAEEIMAAKGAVGREWEDFAILFRTNGQSRKLELAFRERKMPYRMVGAQSFYDRREVRDVLAYAQLLAAPDADVPLLRVLNAPNRGIGQSTAVLATDWSREHHESVWQALCDPNFTDQLGGKSAKAVQEFVATIAGAKNRIEIAQENPADVLDALVKEIEYLPWIERACKTDSERQQRGEGIFSVVDSLRQHLAKGPKKTLQSFLDHSALASDKDDEDLEKKQGVTLITLHASKGLEFPIVFLVGLEEGFLPHTRSIAEGTKDEERRLLYVGITRAQDLLTMTYCSTRIKWGQETGCQPSSFIGELDDEHLLHTTYDDILGAAPSTDELDNFFGGLKGLLDDT